MLVGTKELIQHSSTYPFLQEIAVSVPMAEVMPMPMPRLIAAVIASLREAAHKTTIAGLNIKANIKSHMYPIRIEAKTPMEVIITLVITMDSVGMYTIAGLNIKVNIKSHMYPIRIEAKTPMEAIITLVIIMDSVGMYTP